MNFKCVRCSVCKINRSFSVVVNLIDNFFTQHPYEFKKQDSTEDTESNNLDSPRFNTTSLFNLYNSCQRSRKNHLIRKIMRQNKGFAQFENITNFQRDMYLGDFQQNSNSSFHVIVNNKHCIKQHENQKILNNFTLDELQTIQSEWTSQKSYNPSESQLSTNSS